MQLPLQTILPQGIIQALSNPTIVDRLLLSLSGIILFAIIQRTRKSRSTTKLRGPPVESYLTGTGVLLFGKGREALFKQWCKEYGPVYSVPWVFGTRQVVICDPKAVARYYARETTTYVLPTRSKNFVEALIGRGILSVERADHTRLRKSLTPAFSNAAIRGMTNVFYESTYRVKTIWDDMIEASQSNAVVIDVERWMNAIAIDSIGIAGFGHDFGATKGEEPLVVKAFTAFGSNEPRITTLGFLLLPAAPFLLKRSEVRRNLLNSISSVAKDLLKQAENGTINEKSMIGLLLKSGSADSKFKLSYEEVLGQMNTLLLAGYETTSISLTWTLIELCRQPEIQKKLRQELLSEFPDTDPTWDQLTYSLPYLDAVVHESLRLHPPLDETDRIAAEDDILPLSKPIITASGETVDSIFIAKGTPITAPISAINTLESFWGPDAETFKPERWISEDGLKAASDIKAYRHILSFSDGPRICLGKGFALAEFKAALSVLIRNYSFEFENGQDPGIGTHFGIIRRPKESGQMEAVMPLLVKKMT